MIKYHIYSRIESDCYEIILVKRGKERRKIEKERSKSAIINARWEEKEKRREEVKEVQVKEAIYSGTERIRSRLCGHKSACSYDNPKGG